MSGQLAWLAVWGIMFGFMEAAVVVYLRAIYYPEGFTFPLTVVTSYVMVTEVVREAATLVIMWATVSLAYERLQSRFAAFMVLFGVWDIFYYVFLKLILDWPEALTTWDILFLIPVPWVGPVWAPVLVSAGLIYVGTELLLLNRKRRFIPVSRGFVMLEVLAGAVIIVSFAIPGTCVTQMRAPEYFPWYLFMVGFIVGLSAFLFRLHRTNGR